MAHSVKETHEYKKVVETLTVFLYSWVSFTLTGRGAAGELDGANCDSASDQ
jgi:hypothetical protein